MFLRNKTVYKNREDQKTRDQWTNCHAKILWLYFLKTGKHKSGLSL